jgi:hypothetical protein
LAFVDVQGAPIVDHILDAVGSHGILGSNDKSTSTFAIGPTTALFRLYFNKLTNREGYGDND